MRAGMRYFRKIEVRHFRRVRQLPDCMHQALTDDLRRHGQPVRRLGAAESRSIESINRTGRIRTCNQGIMPTTSVFTAPFGFVVWTIPSSQ